MTETTIGIPRALYYYRYGALWETFFHELGFKTVLSPKTNKQILEAGDHFSVDENCLSSKLFFGHIGALEGKCDLVFVPRIGSLGKSGIMCTRFEAIYDMSRNIFREHNIEFLTCNIDHLDKSPAKKAYLDLALHLGANRKQAQYAYEAAMRAQAESIFKKITDAADLLEKDGVKLLVCGHAYNLHDEYLGVPILKTIHELDAISICSDAMNPKAAREKSVEICENVPWIMNREILGAVAHYHKQVDGIILITAFPCGPDSMLNEMIIRRVKDLPILNLLLDAQSGSAGIETRLESFIDIIRFRKEARLS